MTIIVDTREQKPFFQGRSAPKGIPVIRDSLSGHGGDYSIVGFEHQIIIERKSADDYLGSIFTDTFANTFPLLRAHEVRYIMVERTLESILHMCDPVAFRKKKKDSPISPVRHNDKFGAHPNSVIGKTQSIMSKHGIPIYFASSRKEAQAMTLGILQKFYKAQMEGK